MVADRQNTVINGFPSPFLIKMVFNIRSTLMMRLIACAGDRARWTRIMYGLDTAAEASGQVRPVVTLVRLSLDSRSPGPARTFLTTTATDTLAVEKAIE
jgi:hypothetical protein